MLLQNGFLRVVWLIKKLIIFMWQKLKEKELIYEFNNLKKNEFLPIKNSYISRI